MNERIFELEPAHIPAAMRLNTAAGWNQTADDWARLLKLAPDGCFGLEVDGRLVATTTAVCYGKRLAWIGMVLTDPDFRGRGYARRLMQHALDFLESRGIESIKLDATDMGRPLYLQLGFEDECAVERRFRPPGSISAPEVPVRFDPELDLEAFGADRTALLRSLADVEPGGRPGANAAYFGPCVARSVDEARAALCAFLARHPSESVCWDILPDNRAAAGLARELGFERRRELVRMTKGRRLESNNSYVFAIAGFEYG